MEFNLQAMMAGLVLILSHPLMMLLYGLMAHFCKALGQIRMHTGRTITLRDYYLANPYQTILALIGALAGFFILIPEIQDPTPEVEKLLLACAFTIGFMADSVVDMIGQRSGLTNGNGNGPKIPPPTPGTPP